MYAWVSQESSNKYCNRENYCAYSSTEICTKRTYSTFEIVTFIQQKRLFGKPEMDLCEVQCDGGSTCVVFYFISGSFINCIGYVPRPGEVIIKVGEGPYYVSSPLQY
jgi:hypothetical protein